MTTSEALTILQAVARRPVDAARKRTLFRGESTKHPTIGSSLYRLPEEERIGMFVHHVNLANHFWDDVLGPSLDKRTDGVYLNGRFMGDLQAIENVRSAPSGVDVANQFQPLFQHYGWPTHWLDVSYDPLTALFFACHDHRANRILNEGTGYIYYWDPVEISEREWFIDIVDLMYLAEMLEVALGVSATRPRRQHAACVQMGHPMSNRRHSIEKTLQETKHTLEFSRADALDVVKPPDHYYPEDRVVDLLEAFQRKYIRWHARVAPVAPGESDPLGSLRMHEALLSQRRAARCKKYRVPLQAFERFQDCFYEMTYHGQITRWISKVAAAGGQLTYEQLHDLLMECSKEALEAFLKAESAKRQS